LPIKANCKAAQNGVELSESEKRKLRVTGTARAAEGNHRGGVGTIASQGWLAIVTAGSRLAELFLSLDCN